MKPLVDVNEAAELLGISVWTVRARIREEKLRPVRIGRRVLLKQEELERFVAEAGGTEIPVIPGQSTDGIEHNGTSGATSGR